MKRGPFTISLIFVFVAFFWQAFSQYVMMFSFALALQDKYNAKQKKKVCDATDAATQSRKGG
jgi:hypothetical protein